MVWEIAALIVITLVLLHIFHINRRYNIMLRVQNERFIRINNKSRESIDSEENKTKDLTTTLNQSVWVMSAIKTKRSSNINAVVIDLACFCIIVILGIYNSTNIQEVLAFVLCMIPAYMFVTHFRNISDRAAKKW